MSQQERQRIHNFVYGTDVDGVPAPSDVELGAADQANARATKQYTYSAFAHAAQINLDRLLFYRYITTKIEDYQFGHTMTYGEWLALWTKYCQESWKREALIQAEDARDLRETQQDALS